MPGLNPSAAAYGMPGGGGKEVPPPPPAAAQELSESEQQVSELLERLLLGEPDDASQLGYAVVTAGACSMDHVQASKRMLAALDDTANSAGREGALRVIAALVTSAGKASEPYVVPMLPRVLAAAADKVPSVRDEAAATRAALATGLSRHVIAVVMPMLYDAMAAKAWQTKEAALLMLRQLADVAPEQVAAALPEIVPRAGELLIDLREQVKKAAWSAVGAAFKLNGNRDIEPVVPAMLSCIARPAEVGDTITKLSATTFVQSVATPALAIMVPLLIRGMTHRETPIKRKTAVIIANMAKLVADPSDATVFLPRLLPGLKLLSEEVADPECRDVAAHSHATLLKIEKEAEEATAGSKASTSTRESLLATLKEIAYASAASLDNSASVTLEHVAALALCLISAGNYKAEDWGSCVADYLDPLLGDGDKAQEIAKAFRRRCEEESRPKNEINNNDDGPGEVLADCEFSLAYGGKILLNNARLVIKRGRRYGLCGGNGVGKTTLMRAIAANKVDGFPPPEKLRTVYVEHDIPADLENLNVVDFILADPKLNHLERALVDKTLADVGFSEELRQLVITKISGGWKMKLALCRAVLLKADILLLDEPTNHLDSTNVAWLENYLVEAGITCMIVSHDSGFLDNVCTDIYHYESRRLRLYRGNLSAFVKVKPEAQSYYQLQAATLKFQFPEPGPLDGVTSKEKSILKMLKMGFTYPGASKAALTNVTLHCRLSSRVAVLGANGAGKSTLIKILTGELKPQAGKVDRHPNLRVAYVAQHAFHHIEDHLDTSPARYILRRYSGGEDREEAEKVHRKMTQDEWEKIKNQIWVFDGQNRKLDKIVGRRKKRRTFEYEIAWVGLSSIQYNKWITRDEMVERGFEKLVNEYDGKLASEQKVGEVTRPLTMASIEEYLKDFGLDPEFGTHSNIRGLSGGQKVKLVLASAMWSNPHMLIMDEPTNYLDRESLGALAQSIKEWTGGVVVISHHAEFTSAICKETWHVADGKLTITKETAPEEEAA